MHNNFYFLRQLSRSLEDILINTVVSECFSQHKDELIIRLETQERPFPIKANLQANFSCLNFPEDIHRARKNSIDLFQSIIGHRVASIRQFQNERSFALEFHSNLILLFKMHGNRSNILLFENGKLTELFKKNIPADRQLEIKELDRTINWSYDQFLANLHDLKKLYFTFGKLVWMYLEQLAFDRLSVDERWQLILQIKEELENPVFYITRINGKPHLSLLKTDNISHALHDPIEAINTFFYTYTREATLSQEKNRLLQVIQSRLQGSRNYLEKAVARLNALKEDNDYKTWADLIMANMSSIQPGADRITLPDFYHNKSIEIKLRKDLPPQKNAAVYYRKAKNQHIEIEHLQQNIENKRKEIETLNNMANNLESIDGLKTLRSYAAQLISSTLLDQPASLPYHEFECEGFRILVGKNAASNDELTLRHTFKEDLWLHAKDVSGSHVVIKYQSGKKFPSSVIERAAQLAAYNSKRKTETLCPVIVTPKKYVRKRKGDPPGSVVVEREKVIMVEPKGIG